MFYRASADLLVVFHLLFILFVIFGAVLVYRWRWVALLHIPAAIWGVVVEINSWVCVLTPLENRLRELAGQQGYSGGFIEHYIIPLIYPVSLTHDMQLLMGVSVLIINTCFYSFILFHHME